MIVLIQRPPWEIALHHLVEQSGFMGLLGYLSGLAEEHHTPVVHGMVHCLAGINQPIGQGYGDANRSATSQMLQGAAANRAVQIQIFGLLRVVIVGHGDDEGLLILNKPHVSHHTLR